LNTLIDLILGRYAGGGPVQMTERDYRREPKSPLLGPDTATPEADMTEVPWAPFFRTLNALNSQDHLVTDSPGGRSYFRWGDPLPKPGRDEGTRPLPYHDLGGPYGLGKPASVAEVLKPYEPSIVDYAARLITDGQPGLRSRMVEELLGSRGLGKTGPSIGGVLGATDAMMAGQNLAEGNYGRAAIHGLDAALSGGLASSAGPAFTRGSFRYQPQYIHESFKVPFTSKLGNSGHISGAVYGPDALISSAFMDAGGRGNVGTGEILRAVKSLKEKYPDIERVMAQRIKNKYGNPSRRMEVTLTPEWKSRMNILDELPVFLRP